MYRPVSMPTASTTFMNGPAKAMIRRCQRGLARKLRGSSAATSEGASAGEGLHRSPAILTYPPKGMAEKRKSVSPRRKPNRRVPNPKLKASTLTSNQRAAK